jgi:hypothetical protein
MDGFPRPTKNKGSIVGGRRDPHQPRKALRRVSAKQAKRTDEWQEKFSIYKTEQVKLLGSPYCERGLWHVSSGQPAPCWGELQPDHAIPRGRHPENCDSFSNMQSLCAGCHKWKTETPGQGDQDFRSHAMIEVCKELDKLAQVIEGEIEKGATDE